MRMSPSKGGGDWRHGGHGDFDEVDRNLWSFFCVKSFRLYF